MQNQHIKSGFSLIELLVYIAIFSIVSGFIWQGIRWIEEKNDHLARKQATIRQGLKVFDDVSQMISNSELGDIALVPEVIQSVPGVNNCLTIGGKSLTFKEGPNANANFYALFKYGNTNCAVTPAPSTPSPEEQISDYVFKLDSNANLTGSFFTITSTPNEQIVTFNLKLADKTSDYSTVTFKFRSKWFFNP